MIAPHFFEAFDTTHANRAGEWCKHCNCAKHGDGQEHYDRDTFADYVTAHGLGEPTAEAYDVAQSLMLAGDDYALAAAEVVARGLVIE